MIGGEDPTFDSFTEKEKIALFENVAQKYDKFSYFIIPKANHSFNGFENTIAEKEYEFIRIVMGK